MGVTGNGVSGRVALLDVSLLVALFSPDHIHHEVAHDWFANQRGHGWATCPLTENGFVRIMSNPALSPHWERPAALRERLAAFCNSGHHVFWPDAISLRDDRLFQNPLPIGFQQITDIYLLALACQQGGCLATLDQRIPLSVVIGATPANLQVIAPLTAGPRPAST
jgi:uncharacterized protein